MKYCPNCGAEHRPGFETCSDCLVALVDEPPDPSPPRHEPRTEQLTRTEVFRTGRRIDAELVRGHLEAHGVDAVVWGGGLGVWHTAAAFTEFTGVPNDFNAYRVMVPEADAEPARQLLVDAAPAEHEEMTRLERGYQTTSSRWRGHWLIVAIAVVFIVLLLLSGPPD